MACKSLWRIESILRLSIISPVIGSHCFDFSRGLLFKWSCFSLISLSEQLLFVSAACLCMTTVFLFTFEFWLCVIVLTCSCILMWCLAGFNCILCVLWLTSGGGFPEAWQPIYYFVTSSSLGFHPITQYTYITSLYNITNLNNLTKSVTASVYIVPIHTCHFINVCNFLAII